MKKDLILEDIIPSDRDLQNWGEEYANQHYEEFDSPLSHWWLEAEAFTNGCRAVVEYIKNKTINRMNKGKQESRSYIKATKEGRLYIEIEDLLKSEKVRETISKLMDSDIIREHDNKLEIGKDYIHNNEKWLVINRLGDECNCGFPDDGENYLTNLYCSVPKDWQEATKEQVIEFFEKHLIERYGEDWKNVKIKECMYHGDEYTNEGIYEVHISKRDGLWEVWNKNGCLFNGKEWAEVLEEKKVATDLSEIDRPYYLDPFGAITKSAVVNTINHMTSKELCEGILALQQLIAFRDDFHEVHGKPEGENMFAFNTKEQKDIFEEAHKELFEELKKLY